jgi:hypothetical protein
VTLSATECGQAAARDHALGDERLARAYEAATTHLYDAVCSAIASGANAAVGTPG